jgi:hypothetical protein
LQNRLIQTSQTGGQWYNDTSPFSIPWPRSLTARSQKGRTQLKIWPLGPYSFSLHFTNRPNKLGCLLLASLSNVLYCNTLNYWANE